MSFLCSSFFCMQRYTLTSCTLWLGKDSITFPRPHNRGSFLVFSRSPFLLRSIQKKDVDIIWSSSLFTLLLTWKRRKKGERERVRGRENFELQANPIGKLIDAQMLRMEPLLYKDDNYRAGLGWDTPNNTHWLRAEAPGASFPLASLYSSPE